MQPVKADAALIIIDMQKGMSSPVLGRRNNPDAELNVRRLLDAWRHTQRPVIHIRHISRAPGSVFWPGQAGCEFQVALTPLELEHVVEKNVPDAFANTGLERWLRTRNIQQLIFCGVITNNSVESSVRSAGCLGFDATVVEDACYTFDQTDLTGRLWPAEDVHALSLANMAMDYAKVMDASHVLARLGQATHL